MIDLRRLVLRVLLLAGLAAGLASAGSLNCTLDAGGKTTVVVNNLCPGYVIWKTGGAAFAVVCPGTAPPTGAVELREYYQVQIFLHSGGGG